MDIYLKTVERYLLHQMNTPVSEDARLYRLSLLERGTTQRQQTRLRWFLEPVFRIGSRAGDTKNYRKEQELKMSKEKSMILKMLSRRKISSEEAVKLLEALGEEPALEEALNLDPNKEAPAAVSDESVQEGSMGSVRSVRSVRSVGSDRGTPGFEHRHGWRPRPRFPDPSYAAAIKRHGVDFSADQLIHLEMASVSPAEVESLLTVRRQEWTTDDLARMLVHGVTKEMVLQFHELGLGGLSPKTLIEFAIHRVTPDLVRQARAAGFANIEPQRLVEFAIHKVDFEAVAAAQMLGPVSEEEAMHMSIHGVTTSFIHTLSEAFPAIRSNQLVEMRIHNVSPRYVAELRELDLKDLTSEHVIEMKIHGVKTGEARRFKELLNGDVSASQLIEFAIHGATPDYVSDLHDLGLEDLSPDQLVSMRIHGVSVEAARKANEISGGNLTPDDLVEMAIFGRLP